MCDENYQLPGSVPVFTNPAAGASWGNNTSGAVNVYPGSTARYCAACGYWHNGTCFNAGPALYPQAGGFNVFAQPERKPHTCPVCSGKGKVAGATTRGDTGGETCPACKGACVLWG